MRTRVLDARLRQMLPATVALDASDYVPALVEAARAMNPGIEIEQEDVYELRRRDDSYDLVFLLEVLEHLDHPGAALAELRRVLKPNGWLILGVPASRSGGRSIWREENTLGARQHAWPPQPLVGEIHSHLRESAFRRGRGERDADSLDSRSRQRL